MARTRRDRRAERNAALSSWFWAALAGAGAVAIATQRSVLEEWVTGSVLEEWVTGDVGTSVDFAGRTVRIALAVVGGLAGVILVRALWHTGRWITACRQERMLGDPARAASVPPIGDHRRPLLSVADRGRVAAVGFVVGLGLLAAFAASVRSGNADPPAETFIWGAMAWLGSGVLLVEWRRARRAQRLSEDPGLGGGAEPAPSRLRAAPIPRLEVPLVQPTALGNCPLFEISPTRNVFGRRPPDIAYLRLFDNEDRLDAFVGSAWSEFGYVHYIRGATSVRRSEIKAAEDGRPVFLTSIVDLVRNLDAQPTEPITTQVWTPDRPGYLAQIYKLIPARFHVGRRQPVHRIYPPRALLCHGSFWKSALDLLLRRVDLVVLDLSGYQRKNVGTGYELQRVIDRFRVSDCLLLADQLSDDEFLTAQIHQAWSRMGYGSPNAGDTPRTLLLARTGRWAVAPAGEGGGRIRLSDFQSRSEALSLALVLQQRLDAASAT
jgi:hypothetical protein